jgi:hypothetical protein
MMLYQLLTLYTIKNVVGLLNDKYDGMRFNVRNYSKICLEGLGKTKQSALWKDLKQVPPECKSDMLLLILHLSAILHSYFVNIYKPQI